MASRTRRKSRPARPRSVPTETPLAVIAQTQANDKFSLLDAALTQSGFWPHLEQSLQRAGVPGGEFSILIKPDLELFNPGDSTGTDPELVEHLIDLLHDQGYTRVSVGEARNVWSLWLENRDVAFR